MTARSVALAAHTLLVFAIALVVVEGASGRARACSAPREARHRVRWSSRGAVVIGDPDGRVVAMDRANGAVLTRGRRFQQAHVDVSPDARWAIRAVEDFSDEGAAAGCMATFVDIELVELASGRRRRSIRVRAGASGRVAFSPSGARALVHWLDHGGLGRVELIEVASFRRIRRLEDVARAIWLGDDRVATVLIDGSVGVHEVATGASIAIVPPPAETPDAAALPALLDGDASPSGFTFVTGAAPNRRLSRVDVAARRVAPSPWTTTDAALAVAPSGDVLVASAAPTMGTAQPHTTLRLLERATGRPRLTVRGQYDYLVAAFSPDGSRLAVVSYEAPGPDAAEDMYYSPANEPMNLEILDLASQGAQNRLHWGRAARSTISR